MSQNYFDYVKQSRQTNSTLDQALTIHEVHLAIKHLKTVTPLLLNYEHCEKLNIIVDYLEKLNNDIVRFMYLMNKPHNVAPPINWTEEEINDFLEYNELKDKLSNVGEIKNG